MKGLSKLALAFVAVALPGYALSQTSPPTACHYGEVVLFATNSIHLSKDTTVTGDVVANAASPGPFLAQGVELAIDANNVVNGDLFADSIALENRTTVNGNLLYNQFFNRGATINGTSTQGLPLPVFAKFPVFRQAVVRPSAPNATVGSTQSVTLAAGDYGDVTVASGGTLIFQGGLYNVRSIEAGGTAKVYFSAPTEIRLEGRFHAGQSSVVGPNPAPGTTAAAATIVIYVGGIDGASGDLGSQPRAAQIEKSSLVQANFYVAGGTFRLDRDSTFTGAVLARDIDLQQNVVVTRASAFSNNPPTANPQNVFTQGAGAITIILTASDPDGGDMTVAILTGPSQGTLGPVIQAPAPFPGSPPGCNPENTPGCIPPSPPRTSATVTYTPGGAGNVADFFVFKATNACGNSSEATISINPPGDTTNVPPLVNVDAFDALVETVKDAPVPVALKAGAPATAGQLEFLLNSLPPNGALSNGGNAIESIPTGGYLLANNTLTFTPAAGFAGTTNFGFRARVQGATCLGTPSPQCDDGTVTITVSEQPELAPDSSVSTNLNTPLQLTLPANVGGSGTPGGGFKALGSPRSPVSRSATTRLHAGGSPLPGATIAGNVSDAPPYDGVGDGRDDLPGAAPVLVSAGVDVNLGASPTGVVSDPAGDATNSTADDPANPDLVSATVTASGGNLNLSVRFVAAGFSSSTSRVSFVLDTDENPATGFPGVDAANNDSALMGVEFLVDIGADLGATAQVLKFISLPNSFSTVGTFPATVLADGYDVSIPLSTFDNDDGRMKFKAVTQSYLGGGGFTGILDYVPDLGLSPGQSKTGIQGTARIQIEWDVASLPGADEIESAVVKLHTLKGTVDSLDTVFFVGTANQNGLLDVSDYQAPVSPIPGIVMPVPATGVGVEGTFEFDVTGALKSARAQGFDYFSIQGRLNNEQSLVGGGFQRGLQVRSTATGNLNLGKEPQLQVLTAATQPPPVLVWTITAAPQFGTLKTLGGAPVGVGTTFSLQPTLIYTPNPNYSGPDSIAYRVNQGTVFDTAIVGIFVGATDICVVNGREPGCVPGF